VFKPPNLDCICLIFLISAVDLFPKEDLGSISDENKRGKGSRFWPQKRSLR
jgi:hypothetical protein